ncbi:hypothetical protein PRUB_b1062 [Pseudoalteromonas rubra]|uniref:Uncharacterized protein n=1 Tax=Pseudoalteromonas rubra TaxID=43658 RepID=A0A8T0C1F4_9GAMM|nr:hypothetical protein PRUB_b1062 [Pseudoalteromonas rubra]
MKTTIATTFRRFDLSQCHATWADLALRLCKMPSANKALDFTHD